MTTEGLSADAAIAEVKAAHPRTDPNAGFRAALRRFRGFEISPPLPPLLESTSSCEAAAAEAKGT